MAEPHRPRTLQYILQVAQKMGPESMESNEHITATGRITKAHILLVVCDALFANEKQRSIKGSQNASWEFYDLRQITSSMKWG